MVLKLVSNWSKVVISWLISNVPKKKLEKLETSLLLVHDDLYQLGLINLKNN